jgi:hypothetical protein
MSQNPNRIPLLTTVSALMQRVKNKLIVKTYLTVMKAALYVDNAHRLSK